MLLTTEDDELYNFLLESMSAASEIDIVTGYMSAGGFELFSEVFEKCVENNGRVRIIIGEPFQNANYSSCLQLVQKWDDRIQVWVSMFPKSLVHAKMYVARGNENVIVIGSSNFTVQGLRVNKEINTVVPATAETDRRITQYYESLLKSSISLSEYMKIAGGPAMEQSTMPYLTEFDYQRLCKLGDTIFPDICQSKVQRWIEQIETMSKSLHSVLNDYYDDGDAEDIKYFLLNEIWAITEAKHTDLYLRVKATVASRLAKAVTRMCSSAGAAGLDPDAVLVEGKIPSVIGTSTASEILHKYDFQRYAIKNKRSNWGMGFILDQGTGPSFAESLNYREFINYADAIYVLYERWLLSKGVQGSHAHRYFLVDQFFYFLSEEPNHAEMIRMVERSASSKWF